VASDVPARAASGVGKEGTHTRNIFLGFLGVKLVFDFVVFEWNGEKAIAVDAAHGGPRSGVVYAELKPKKVTEINEQEQGERREEDTARDVVEGRRGIGKVGWWSGHEFRVAELSLNSDVEEGFLHSGTAESAVPPVEMTDFRLSCCRTVQLYQHGDGDAFIAAIEVAVAAQIGAMFDGVARVVLEDAPLFAEDDARNHAFFLAAQQ